MHKLYFFHNISFFLNNFFTVYTHNHAEHIIIIIIISKWMSVCTYIYVTKAGTEKYKQTS